MNTPENLVTSLLFGVLVYQIAKKKYDISTFRDVFIKIIRSKFANVIVDRIVSSLNWGKITSNINDCEFKTFRISSAELEAWAIEYYPQYKNRFAGDFRHKKIIEYFTTFHILGTDHQHVIMDAAGGSGGYLPQLGCKRRILQDISISNDVRKNLEGSGVECIELDAGSIPLPDESVDSISCHHSFEHFQGRSDIEYIKEVQRILVVGGNCCIVPILIANKYAEITDTLSLKLKFDKRSLRIIDPTATIPGKKYSGNYARVYDIQAFQQRVMEQIDLSRFKVTIYSMELDCNLLPTMNLECHKTVTSVNFPYRALVITRIL